MDIFEEMGIVKIEHIVIGKAWVRMWIRFETNTDPKHLVNVYYRVYFISSVLWIRIRIQEFK